MSDTVLWVLAVGVGVIGFLLLFIAAGVAFFLRSENRDLNARGSAPAAGRAEAPGQTASAQAATGQPDAPAPEYPETPAPTPAGGGLWAWIKAWLFASVHAVTVSLVLGAVTFFEDLARASDEIEHTGTVTFPKRLMPGATVQPASPRRLSEPVPPVEDVDPADIELSDPGDWEIVDFVQEPTSSERSG
jgi:hypothetical protein